MSISEAGLLLLAGVEVITFTTVEGVLYGFTFALYISCARLLYLQLQDQGRRKQNLFTLLYISLTMALALLILAVDSREIQVSYVDHADYPGGGGLGYSLDVFSLTSLVMMENVAMIILQFMMFAIQIWRLWIVWRVSHYSFLIVVFPVLSSFVYLGFSIANNLMVARSELTSRLIQMFIYGQYIPQLCISAIVTIPIIVRIVIVRRRNMEIMGQTTTPYTSVISILVESFALEFLWTLVQVPLIPFDSAAVSATGVFFSETLPFIQILAYLLVVYRVTTGRGWKEGTEEKLTTLQWNHDGLPTTQNSTRASIPITLEDA